MIDRRSSPGAADYGRSAALLGSAVGTAGLLTYLFFALASHSLDREDYGRIVVLWSLMFVAISVLFRPIEQLLSRTVAELEMQDRSTVHALRVAAQIQIAIGVIFTLVALALKSELEARLFDGDELFFWALLASVLGFGASFFARGYLAGSGRFGLFAWLLLIDAVARTLFAFIVAVGIADGPDPLAIGIAIAPGLSAAVLPLAFRARRHADTPPDASDTHSQFTLAEGSGFAASILIVMLSEQIFLNSGPLFARAELGAAAAGFIFNVLMVVRAPVIVFQGAATSLLPHLTRLRATEGEDSEAAFRDSILVTLLAVAAFGALTVAIVLAVGPALMEAAFGSKFTYDRAGLAIVAFGMGFFLAATTLNQAALAQGQARRAATCWALAAGAMLAFYAVPAFDIFRRIELGFSAAAALLFAMLYLTYRHPTPRPDETLEPGSPRELEARVAAANEAL